MHASRRVFALLKEQQIDNAVIHHWRLAASELVPESRPASARRWAGCCATARRRRVLEPQAGADFDLEMMRTTSFGLLQGSRMRSTKTEFVSCPSCGRTLFDLQEVTAQISERTGHIPGVTIAIIECIVNGPGEMADADFGYVGGAPGKVDLYVGKEVRRSIPNDDACDQLIELIQEHGMWKTERRRRRRGAAQAA